MNNPPADTLHVTPTSVHDDDQPRASRVHPLAVGGFYTVLFTAYFAPVWSSGGMLAPGDGTTYHIPAFFMRLSLWTPDILAGFPIAAEPTTQLYYPVARFFALFGAWNLYVISAYVLAACFTYGFVFSLTRSPLAALASGLIYGGSGFLIVRLGHVTILHGAAWIPLLLWSVEQLRRKPDARWIAAASAAVGLCAVGGHPQMMVYGLGLSIAYAVVTGWSLSWRWRYYATCGLAILLGCGVGAVQLVPTAELGRLSVRAAMTFDVAVQFAVAPVETIRLIFPYVFGSNGYPPYNFPYVGTWSPTETTTYVGWLTLGAVGIGATCWRDAPLTRFWVSVALVSFLLALGDATPLARLMYYVPAYNWFRCPGRHLVETTLAMATLAGLGIAVLERSDTANLWRRAAAIVLAIAGSGIVFLALLGDRIHAAAASRGVPEYSLAAWSNLAVCVPLLFAGLTAAVLLWQSSRFSRALRRAALLAVLLTDLGSFGWSYEWRFASPAATVLEIPASLRAYRENVVARHSRVLTFDWPAPTDAAPPNLNWLWGVPSASGNTSIPLNRYAAAFAAGGASLLDPNAQVLDMLAVQYLFLAPDQRHGFGWVRTSTVVLKRTQRRRVEWLSGDAWATHIAIVGGLANSLLFADGTEVGRLQITTTEGDTMAIPLRAGQHLSESDYDRSDVVAHVRHRRAELFDSTPVTDKDESFLRHTYLAVLDLGGRYQIRHLAVEVTQPRVVIVVNRLNLEDQRNPEGSAPRIAVDRGHWRDAGSTDAVIVLENQRALPRAWLVGRTVTLDADTILRTLGTARLPDGARFDPRDVAMIEEPLSLPARASADGTAQVIAVEDTRVRIHVQSATPAFLVSSDVYYPGWTATVDGNTTPVYQTNYILRGIQVPAGDHAVVFTFRPFSAYLGWAVSLLSLIGVATVKWWWPPARVSPERRTARDGTRALHGPRAPVHV